MNAKQLIKDAEQRLLTECHKNLTQASAQELHNAVSGAAMDALAPVWVRKESQRFPRRQAAYLSMEFLVGRLIYNNLYCMGLLDEVKTLLKEKGVDIAVMEDIEDDAFGNGGLGRLAACFLDSAVTCNVPLTGYGLRFRYGLFKQDFVDGPSAGLMKLWLFPLRQAMSLPSLMICLLSVMEPKMSGPFACGRQKAPMKLISLYSTARITRGQPQVKTRLRILPNSCIRMTAGKKANSCGSNSSMYWFPLRCRIYFVLTGNATALIILSLPKKWPHS